MLFRKIYFNIMSFVEFAWEFFGEKKETVFKHGTDIKDWKIAYREIYAFVFEWQGVGVLGEGSEFTDINVYGNSIGTFI
ncbi:hypothetical protein GSbR_15450 [Geobacter sp. SVR]|nr:hypothetical protein GSVR_00660 [Geobacter sp. SVR]GCF84945.1 hypothetical protein GSbR_15450 [Geobacter sp. SVR]